MLWTDNMVLLKEIENPVSAMMLIDWYYQPKIAAEVAEYVNYITPVPSAAGRSSQSDAAKATGSDQRDARVDRQEPAGLPDRRRLQRALPLPHPDQQRADRLEQHLRARLPVVIARLKSASGPYLSVLPGGLWLAIFFVLPLFVMVSLSLQTGNLIDGFQQTFHFANYSHVISTLPRPAAAIAVVRADRHVAVCPHRLPDGLLDRVLRRSQQVDVPVPGAAAVLRDLRAAYRRLAVPARRPGPRARLAEERRHRRPELPRTRDRRSR